MGCEGLKLRERQGQGGSQERDQVLLRLGSAYWADQQPVVEQGGGKMLKVDLWFSEGSFPNILILTSRHGKEENQARLGKLEKENGHSAPPPPRAP